MWTPLLMLIMLKNILEQMKDKIRLVVLAVKNRDSSNPLHPYHNLHRR
jgi:hypothetical protein